jgi:hypothetical protein
MTRRQQQQLGQLAIIARMLYENDQIKLQRAAEMKRQVEDRLDLLNLSLTAITAWESVAAAQAALVYESWADNQRRDLNLELAQRTVIWIEARDSSRSSFGRKLAINHLLKSEA